MKNLINWISIVLRLIILVVLTWAIYSMCTLHYNVDDVMLKVDDVILRTVLSACLGCSFGRNLVSLILNIQKIT